MAESKLMEKRIIYKKTESMKRELVTLMNIISVRGGGVR